MANTYVDSTATADQTDFPFNFPYLKDTHVIVSIDGTETDINDTGTGEFTISTSPSTKVVLGTGATVGASVRIKRNSLGKTNAETTPLVNYTDGSVLTEKELDDAYLHNFYLSQEAVEDAAGGMALESSLTNWDAQNKKLINVGTPTADFDASTKEYVDSKVVLTGTNLTGFSKSTHTGDASATQFTLSFTPQTTEAKAYIVSIDGVLQVPDTAYTLDATSITFTSAPPASSVVCVVATATASGISANTAQVTATGSSQARSLADRFDDVVNVKDYGALGNGSANDTDKIQEALNTTAKAVYFPKGNYVIQATSETTGDFAVTSAVADRKIYGEGVITASTVVKRAFQLTGDRTDFSLDCDGNEKICHYVKAAANDCVIHDCRVKDLKAAADTFSTCAIDIDLSGKDGGAIVRDNFIDNLLNDGDGINGTGIGLTKGILVQSDANRKSKILITGNYIGQVDGEEGDSIAIISSAGSSNSLGLGTYYDMPCFITGNTIFGWSRRAIKVQANAVSIVNNCFENNKTTEEEIANLQGVVDLVQGDHHVVSNNVFRNCKYSNQVKAICGNQDGLSSLNNITCNNNYFTGIGEETEFTLTYFSLGKAESVEKTNITIGSAGSGDSFNVSVDGNTLSPAVAFNTNNATTAADLKTAIEADSTINALVTVVDNSDGSLTLTAQSVNDPLYVSLTLATDGGNGATHAESITQRAAADSKGHYLSVQNNFYDIGNFTGHTVIGISRVDRALITNNNISQGNGSYIPFEETLCENVAYSNLLGTGVYPPSIRLSNPDQNFNSNQKIGSLEFEVVKTDGSVKTWDVHGSINGYVDAGTSGAINLRFNCNENDHRMTLDKDGDLLPATNNTQDLGSSSTRWANANLGTLSANALPTYADESAASSLTAGQLYKTSTGEVRVKL